ncbi:MAG: type II toxin-antitoxin system HicA family toxin [Pseudomonadota bacterium]
MNSKKLLKILKDNGWEVDRVRGSHHQLKHPFKSGLVTIPHPTKDLPVGTVKMIKKQAGLD